MTIFSKEVPFDYLCELIGPYANQTETNYIIGENVFKTMIFTGKHKIFLNNLKSYYLESHHHYITREFTYNSFLNILRQICRTHHYPFHTKTLYNKSKSSVVFFLQKPAKDLIEKNHI